MSPIKVAILDGEFDLNHASGNLMFGQPHSNQTDGTTGVDVTNNHAHGTLCAGLIGALPGIEGWDEGGIAPDVTMIPVSVYRTAEPVRAELQDLIDGINFAIDEHCKVISVSLSGFPPSAGLFDVVERAKRTETVIVAGTGNRRIDERGSAGSVGFPARFGTVLGVGAGMVTEANAVRSLTPVESEPSGQFDGNPPWDSKYGLGLDVVAQGLGVTSTDISDSDGANIEESPEGDIWSGFSGTSAATPIVAGFAAIIAARGYVSGSSIRREIRRAAERIGPQKYTRERNGLKWNRRVGFGWIDRDTVTGWLEGASDPGSDEMSDTQESSVPCMADELIEEVDGEEGYEYARKFEDAIRPLADFLAALGSTEQDCCTMAAHFWRYPYRTARIAGLPWQAAILLGGGDWPAVYHAINAEYEGTPESDRPPGPIWVRAR